jgi:chromosome segregation ATPase
MANLKEILGDSYTDEIASKFKDIDIFEKGKAMPMEKYNSKVEELNSKNKEYKEQVDTLNKNLKSTNIAFEDIKAKAEGNEELQKKLEEYENQINETQNKFTTTLTEKEKEWQERNINNKKTYTLRERLLQEHADKDYLDMIVSRVDLNKITPNEDGTFNGVGDIVKTAKESYSKLFGKEQIIGTGVQSGISPAATGANLKELAKKAAQTGQIKDRIAYAKAKQEQSE